MTHINKQRFLTELSKFLTFLSDDEREQVLMKFGEIFDAAPSSDELMAALVSPLKVTVELSRAYSKGGIQSALERAVEMSGVELSAQPAAESASDEASPAAEGDEPAPEQESEEAPEPPAEKPDTEAFADAVGFESPARPDFPAAQPPEEAPPSPAAAETDTQPEDIYDSIGSAVEAAFENGTDAASAPDVTPAAKPEPAAEETAEPPAKSESAPKPAAEKYVSVPVPASAPPVSDEPEQDFEDEELEEAPEKALKPAARSKAKPRARTKAKAKPAPKPLGKVKPFMLVLFIIIFVPLGLAGIAVLLAVTAAILVAMVSAGGSGVFAVSLAFSGMTLFADIIMTIGMALVCFAFAVVLLWLAVWFAIWSIGGLVRGIIRLGRKWCYKEAAE